MRGLTLAAALAVVLTAIPQASAQAPVIPGAGGAVRSSPVALNGFVYFGDGVGNMCCREIANPVNGWDLNTRTNGGSQTSVVLGRPSLNMIGGTLYLYFLTNDTYLFCVEAETGHKVWSSAHAYCYHSFDNDTTPAVVTGNGLADTVVYLSLYSKGYGMYQNDGVVLAVRGDNGVKQYDSGNLIRQDATEVKISSPAAYPGGVYVSVVGGNYAGYRLNPADLSVQAGLGAGVDAGTPPYVYHHDGVGRPCVLITGRDGTLSAFNASNGEVQFEGVQLTRYPLTLPIAWNDVVYTAGEDGFIYHASAMDGSDPGNNYVFYAGASGQAIQGLALDPRGLNNEPTLLFGTDAGDYYKVPLSNPAGVVIIEQSGTGAGVFGTTPTIDRTKEVSLIGSDDGNVYVFDRN